MNNNHKKRFKILSLDGGGVRGMISVTILKEFEKQLDRYCQKHGLKPVKLHDYFDLVAGTSTGSILAAGIAGEKSADDLIKLYQESATTIFNSRVRRLRNLGILTKYILQILFPQFCLYPNQDNQGLAKVLQEQLRNEEGKPLRLNKIKKTILFIPAYDTYSRNTTWFASNRKGTEVWFQNIELWKLCVSSAAAPTFFPPYPLLYLEGVELTTVALFRGNKNLALSLLWIIILQVLESPYVKRKYLPHIDGGVSANNPSLSAIAHLLVTEKKSNLNNISVLAIGTGNTTQVFTYDEIKKWGVVGIIKHISEIFLNPGSQNTDAICQEFLRSVATPDHCNYLRLNFDLNQSLEGERQKGFLRSPVKPHKNAVNEYVNKHISEAIDNPNLCVKQEDLDKSLLEEVTDAYLDFRKRETVYKIKRFIEDNPPN